MRSLVLAACMLLACESSTGPPAPDYSEEYAGMWTFQLTELETGVEHAWSCPGVVYFEDVTASPVVGYVATTATMGKCNSGALPHTATFEGVQVVLRFLTPCDAPWVELVGWRQDERLELTGEVTTTCGDMAIHESFLFQGAWSK